MAYFKEKSGFFIVNYGVLCQVVYAHGNPHTGGRRNVYNNVDNVDKSYKCRKYA